MTRAERDRLHGDVDEWETRVENLLRNKAQPIVTRRRASAAEVCRRLMPVSLFVIAACLIAVGMLIERAIS